MTDEQLTTAPSAEDLMALVGKWSGYVRARVNRNDAEDVLQTIRETVLSRTSSYDPAFAEPGAWVFGIVRTTVKAARRVRATHNGRFRAVDEGQALVDEGPDGADPLSVVIAAHPDLRWVRVVADAATSFEWQVIVAYAQNEGCSAEVAELMGSRPSTVRDARARVAALTRTALSATRRAEEGLPVTLEECVPVDGGYADVLPYWHANETVAADALGISRSAFRTRRAMLRRLNLIVTALCPIPSSKESS